MFILNAQLHVGIYPFVVCLRYFSCDRSSYIFARCRVVQIKTRFRILFRSCLQIISWWLKDRSHSDESGRQLERLRNIAQIAERLECSLTQLCIAWCLKNESVQCLLLGATSVRQLYHTLQSLKVSLIKFVSGYDR